MCLFLEELSYGQIPIGSYAVTCISAGAYERFGTDFTSALSTRRLEGRSVLRRKDGSEIEIEFRAHEAVVAGMPFFVSVGWPVSGD